MDPGDLEPAEMLQVPTGSKRPSPSPSEGEQDREVKKFRTQPSSFGDVELQNNDLVFPFTDLPYGNYFGSQTDPIWSSQDVHGMPFGTTTGFDIGSELSAELFTGGDIDYATNFDAGFPTTAMYENLVIDDNTCWGDPFSRNSNQASASFIYGHPSTGADYAEQPGGFTAGGVIFQDQLQHALVNEGQVPAASQDVTPEFGVLSRVESIPIRPALMDETPPQMPVASPPKESTDVPMGCDTCFGVVSYSFVPLHDLL